jgi:hypothetical protein
VKAEGLMEWFLVNDKMDGWMDGWTNGWMDIDRKVHR